MTRMMNVSLSLCFLLFTTIAVEAQGLNQGICPDNLTNSYVLQGHQNALMPDVAPASFAERQGMIAAPEYSPVLMDATSLGAGAEGSFPVDNNLFLRISIINLYNPLSYVYGASPYNSQGMLMPIQLGMRFPLLRSTLGSLGYTLYGETFAGLLLGWAYPTNGSFLNYSLPYSRFSSGGSAYMGIGNSVRLDKYVGVYLNGGLGYYDFFSTNILPRSSYLVPSVAAGFYFNLGRF